MKVGDALAELNLVAPNESKGICDTAQRPYHISTCEGVFREPASINAQLLQLAHYQAKLGMYQYL